MTSFQGKRVLITGAGSGIGRATAQAFAKQSATLFLCDINEAGLEETRTQLLESGAQVTTFHCNVADAESVAIMADAIHQDIPGLDILIINAGSGSEGRFVETSLDTWNKVIDVNVKGVVHGCHHFVPQMIAAKNGGHVVNLASAAAYVAPKDMPIYATTKFAVLGFSESLRADLHKENINVSAICPGIINTNIVKNTLYEGELGSTETFKKDAVAFYARRNYGPERVAEAIIRAIEKQRAVQPVSPEAWLLYYAKRLMPKLVDIFNRRDLDLANR